ncbi:tol-pal system protein YbgF [Palleronia rufa]|uniref:tol-pal system protein YbgF n=1 Tax=Palleronia rufa TaxID=1530186 RepID=UPI00055B3C5E|nr:tol-pal system protein YbgF [Palleronia rufa]
MLRALSVLACVGTLAGPALAQDGQTLADIRQEIQVLLVEVGRLKRELSTTGAPQTSLTGTSALERIDAMEAELRRLTSSTEEVENRVNRVVSDGTNRLGDLRFRVCELDDGCDLGSLGETPPLGGVDVPTAAPAQNVTDGAQLAIGEQADFDRAKEALDSGSFRSAADLFETFTETYTGGALTGEAHFYRGQALSELGDDKAAARAYLASYSGSPDGALAPDALLQLGRKLDAVGQTADACATLGEVPSLFPGSEAAAESETARASIGCQ